MEAKKQHLALVSGEYGADSLSKREGAGYNLAPSFERGVIALLATHKRFYESIASYIEASLFSDGIPQLIVKACKLTQQALGHAPQDFDLVLQSISNLVQEGHATHEQVQAAKDYFDYAVEEGLPRWDDALKQLKPTIQTRLELELYRESRDVMSKRADPARVRAVIKKMERFGTYQEFEGANTDEEVMSLIKILEATERMRTGIPMIDNETNQGFFRGTTTTYLGGTGAGKSLALMQGAAFMTSIGLDVTYASLSDLTAEWQWIRYVANMIHWKINEVKKDIAGAMKLLNARFPNRGRMKIEFFPSGTPLERIIEWREEQKAKFKSQFPGFFLDYFNELAGSDENTGDTKKILTRSARIFLEYGQSSRCWNFTAAAPQRQADRPVKKGKDGSIPWPHNDNAGECIKIVQKFDTNIWLQRVLRTEESGPGDFDIYPICTKDRHGASDRGAWVGQPLMHEYEYGRICGTPAQDAEPIKDDVL